jgi:hypothetical protein
MHAPVEIVYCRAQETDGKGFATWAASHVVATLFRSDSQAVAEVFRPASLGTEALRLLDDKVGAEARRVLLIVDYVHHVDDDAVAMAVRATGNLQWLMLGRPSIAVTTLSQRLNVPLLALRGWNDDTVAQVMAECRVVCDPLSVRDARIVTGGAPLLVENIARLAAAEQTTLGAYMAVFECNVACVGSPEGCSYSAETGVVEQRGYHRWNASTSTLDAFTMRRVAAVVDGVGVRVQYTGDPTDTGGSGPMIVVIPGAGGDGGLAAAESIRQWFEIRADADTAVIDFETAMPIHPQPTGEWAGGWQSRSSNAPASYEELTARVSAVVDWVREHLAEPGQEIVTVGCSMGCLATLGGPLWHDQDFYALQVFVGGPPMWDINAGCGRMPVSYELPVAPADVTTYGGARLATATFCNDELDPSCIPYGAVQSWRFVKRGSPAAEQRAGVPIGPIVRDGRPAHGADGQLVAVHPGGRLGAALPDGVLREHRRGRGARGPVDGACLP